LKFINFADEHRILILILPPHSTHHLQPLDVGLFSPLASAYTTELNNLMHNSLGMVSMSKRFFWSLFHPAWKQSFTEKNIVSAFEKTGIFPFNPERVLFIIELKAETPKAKKLLQESTPITSRTLC